MARRPDVVQRPCGSNSLLSSSIQGRILHVLHKMAKHPPLVIPTWQGEWNYMHQFFWSMLIYDKLALICHHPCFDTAIRSRETARRKAKFSHLLKGEVKAKIKISPVVVFGVLSRMVLVRESWDAPFLLESQSNSRTSTETGWLRPTRWGFVCKMSLKAPFRSYKSTDHRDWPICCSLLDAESTGFGPKRLRCSVPPLFPIEHGWTSGHVLLGAKITWSPRQQATTFTPRFNSSDRTAPKKGQNRL